MESRPYLVSAYCQHQKEQQFELLDDVVEWFANELGERDSEWLRAQLDDRLMAYGSQSSLNEVRSYAEQIRLAARVTDSPVDGKCLAAIKLARAVFHISAIRSTKRRQLRSRLIRRLQNEFSTVELMAAKRVLERKYNTPNESFHRPFLNLLTWDEEQTEECRIGQPVSSNTQTVVAYSKNFGVANPTNSQQIKRTNWGWVAFAIFCGVIVSVIARSPSTKKQFQNNVGPNQFSAKTSVIVFDKDDPNKYAIEKMNFVEAIGQPTRLIVSEEHPGPFVQVPLSEINREESNKGLNRRSTNPREVRDPFAKTSPYNPTGLPGRLPADVRELIEKNE